MKRVFHIENLTSNNVKSSSSCQYVQIATSKITQHVAVIKADFKYFDYQLSEDILFTKSHQFGFRKARSVPLYILYQQLRSSLI